MDFERLRQLKAQHGGVHVPPRSTRQQGVGGNIAKARKEVTLAQHVTDCMREEFARINRVGVNFPTHLFPPAGSFPYYEVNSANNVGNTLTVIVDHQFEQNLVGHVAWWGSQVSDLQNGATEGIIEYRLQYDNKGINPFSQCRGPISTLNKPLKGLIVQKIPEGARVTLSARVLPTAEGGIDGGTADIMAAVAGWMFSANDLLE